VPATVTIPAGQASATFTVATIDDHTPDGLQHVQISATLRRELELAGGENKS